MFKIKLLCILAAEVRSQYKLRSSPKMKVKGFGSYGSLSSLPLRTIERHDSFGNSDHHVMTVLGVSTGVITLILSSHRHDHCVITKYFYWGAKVYTCGIVVMLISPFCFFLSCHRRKRGYLCTSMLREGHWDFVVCFISHQPLISCCQNTLENFTGIYPPSLSCSG